MSTKAIQTAAILLAVALLFSFACQKPEAPQEEPAVEIETPVLTEEEQEPQVGDLVNEFQEEKTEQTKESAKED